MSIHLPSSPTRNPVEHFYFTITSPDGENDSFFTYGFGTFTSAQYWLEQLLKLDHSWQDENTIIFTKKKYTMTLKGSHLEDVIEHTPPKREEPYIIQHPSIRVLDRALTFWEPRHRNTPAPVTDKSEKPKPAPAQKKDRPTKGAVTVGDMAKELGIPATKARSILRKAKVEKPPQGWTFEAGTDLEAEIFDIIKAGR